MFYTYVQELIKRGNELNSLSVPFNGTDSKRLSTGFPNTYKKLEVKVGFGKGNWAKIPWVGFLEKGQKVTKGIYPVLLYYREINLLILAHGVSANNQPDIKWALSSPITIGKYFAKHKISAYNKYNQSFVYKVYEADKVDKTIDDDINALITLYKSYLASVKPVLPMPTSTSTSKPASVITPKTMIGSIIKTITSSGLVYSEQFINRFVISLMTKPFVILSGLSGSGKTQLAIAFARAMSDDIKKQVRIVPVGADWTNREPLLGYPSALEKGKYIHPDSQVLQLIIDANEDPSRPYFLILDEMNLSYVERYFADFLSTLESRAEIPLWKHDNKDDDGDVEPVVPESIKLPRNLYIIGTINVDETTYMFSPKVLDRAIVLEFKLEESDIEKYINEAPNVDLESINSLLSPYASLFVEISQKEVTSGLTKSKDALLSFFKELKSVNAEFGYRSASEIGRFIALATDVGGFKLEDAVDAAIVQKLLPKLHGSLKKLNPVLRALWEKSGTGIDLNRDASVPDKTTYKLAADKILRMYKGAFDNGFTSFAEA